jgi:hypothetical protein
MISLWVATAMRAGCLVARRAERRHAVPQVAVDDRGETGAVACSRVDLTYSLNTVRA